MGKQSETPCAVFWRARRRQQGIPPKADMPTIIPESVYQTGREITAMLMVPALNWPKDLYSSASDSSVQFAPKKVDTAKCQCGCGFNHNHAVSGLEGEAGSRRVVWFSNMRCRNKYFGIGEKNGRR